MRHRFALPQRPHGACRVHVVRPDGRVSTEDEALTNTICDVLTDPGAGIDAVWVAGLAPEDVASIAAAAAARGLQPAHPT